MPNPSAVVAPLLVALLGAAGLAAPASTARAGDAPVPDPREEIRTVLFGGFDAGSASFASVGAKRAFGPIDRDGPLVMGGAGYGARFERDGAAPRAPDRAPPLVTRHTVLAHALAGWQWSFDWGVVAALAGPEMSFEHVGSRFVPRQPGPRFGGRLHGEVWARPGEDTLLTATLIAGSARGDLWGRLSWGWRAWGVYLGPEASRYMDRTGYAKTGLGLHATGLELWGLTFRVSAGYLREEPAGRDGGYVALAVWTPW